MAVSARLSRALRDSLGEEGADALVNWMIQVEASRSELYNVIDAWKVTTDSRFNEFEARIDLRFSEQQRWMDGRFSEQQRWTEGRFAEHQQEMRTGFANLETRFERRFGDLLKWSFVFWCGAVGAVAMLARALR